MRVVVTHSGSGSLLAADFASQLLNVVQHLIGCRCDEFDWQRGRRSDGYFVPRWNWRRRERRVGWWIVSISLSRTRRLVKVRWGMEGLLFVLRCQSQIRNFNEGFSRIKSVQTTMKEMIQIDWETYRIEVVSWSHCFGILCPSDAILHQSRERHRLELFQITAAIQHLILILTPASTPHAEEDKCQDYNDNSRYRCANCNSENFTIQFTLLALVIPLAPDYNNKLIN